MDTLTQLLVLAIGTSSLSGAGSANTVDSSSSVKCLDAVSCMPDSDRLTSAIENTNFDVVCNILTTSNACLKSAIDDCKETGLIPEEALQNIENSYQSSKAQVSQYCQAPTGGDVSCLEATSCIPDVDRLTDAINNGRNQEACNTLTTSTTCLQSAADDCRARGVMSEEDMKQLEDTKKSYEPQLALMCQAGSQPSGGGVSCMQMSTCVPDQTRLNKSLENMDYQEACKIVKPSIECQTSAMEDCKTRGLFDASILEEMEKGIKMAKREMDKYCSSGNSVSASMLCMFLATAVWVFMTKFMSSRI